MRIFRCWNPRWTSRGLVVFAPLGCRHVEPIEPPLVKPARLTGFLGWRFFQGSLSTAAQRLHFLIVVLNFLPSLVLWVRFAARVVVLLHRCLRVHTACRIAAYWLDVGPASGRLRHGGSLARRACGGPGLSRRLQAGRAFPRRFFTFLLVHEELSGFVDRSSISHVCVSLLATFLHVAESSTAVTARHAALLSDMAGSSAPEAERDPTWGENQRRAALFFVIGRKVQHTNAISIFTKTAQTTCRLTNSRIPQRASTRIRTRLEFELDLKLHPRPVLRFINRPPL